MGGKRARGGMSSVLPNLADSSRGDAARRRREHWLELETRPDRSWAVLEPRGIHAPVP